MLGKILLLMDNVKDTLDTWSRLLEEVGYLVEKASTLEDAQNVMRNKWIHLAILDIRMVNENDENDISGLLLAQEPEFLVIPKIILTAYPSFEYARLVLAPDVDGHRPAINFVAKNEGPRKLLEAVELAFANQVRINRNLNIQIDPHEPLSFPHLANLVQPNLPNDILIFRASELEDLIRKLFYDYQQIRIGRLLWHDSQRFCLPVLAYSSQGTTDSRLLVCGDRERLRQDREKLGEFAPKAIQGTRISDHPVETTHLSAILCELPGADIETVQSLRDLFHVGKEKPLKAAFEYLLGDVLKAWHQHGEIVQKKDDLISLYRQWVGLTEGRVPQKEVEQRVASLVQSARTLEAIEIKADNEQLTFHFPRQSPLHYPDPVATVYSLLTKYDAQVVCKASPGRLTADSVLVDANQKTWLTDFMSAGQAPQWWDFVCLEASIRFDLSQAPDLLAWQEFEECLVRPTRLDEKLEQSDVIPELRTSIVLIEQIRQQAASETGYNPLPYYAGLLVWTVEAMAHYDSGVLYTQADRLRSAHLLLAASMIAGRLDTATDTDQVEGRLRFDEDGSVWIRERRVATLTGLSQKLLTCLFVHEGKVVNNRMIIEAYGEKCVDGEAGQDQRIRQEIRRLREEIEPDPNHPHYILTERGKGYRLRISKSRDSLCLADEETSKKPEIL